MIVSFGKSDNVGSVFLRVNKFTWVINDCDANNGTVNTV